MSKQLTNNKKGFTIIEVVLVLAIAGLIFLMVFTALPAMQRSQRDTARRDDLARFLTQITNYQTNNRGKLPGTGATDGATMAKDYANFMINYLWAGGDQFVDPDGELYQIGGVCVKFGDSGSAKWGNGATCEGTGIASTDTTTVSKLPETNPLIKNVAAADWDGKTPTEYTTLLNASADPKEFNHSIYIYQNAKCDGESVAKGTGARNLAIQFKLEGGGIYCGAV